MRQVIKISFDQDDWEISPFAVPVTHHTVLFYIFLFSGTSAHSTLFADVAVWHAHVDDASLESTFPTRPTMLQTRGVPVLFMVDKRRQTPTNYDKPTNDDK
jgi:hypothetical protein